MSLLPSTFPSLILYHFHEFTLQHALFTTAMTLVLGVLISSVWKANGGKSVSPSCSPQSSPSLVPHTTPSLSITTPHDIIIVGAGVAGASLALSLSRRESSKHLRILLIERDLSEQHRIVGELLQPDGYERVKALGLQDTLEGIDAQIIYGYGLLLGDEYTHLQYPVIPNTAPHRAQGRSFHNGRWVQKMRETLKSYPNVELRQGTVTKLDYDSTGRVSGVTYRTEKGIESTSAPLTIVCDGCFSGLRTSLCKEEWKASTTSRFLGLIIRNTSLPFNNHGHVFLVDPSPILCYPISSTEARVLIDFPERVPTDETELEDHLLNHVLPQLPTMIQPAFRDAVIERSFKCMPNQTMGAAPNHIRGVVMIGDSINMRHPLTGGGMTVALTDVERLITLMEEMKYDMTQTESLDTLITHHYATRHHNNACINILADALYDVFSQKYPDLRDACYHYLKKGGAYSGGPVRLLSGLSRSQAFLISHFFAVAFFGIWRLLFPIITPHGLITSLRVLRQACYIIMPLIARENSGSIFIRGLCRVICIIMWV